MKVKIGAKEEYEKFVDINSNDFYSYGVIKYMHRWADLMEKEIDGGKKLSDIAEKTSHDADIEGITGFMYGVAVNALSRFWEYGEELSTWHNSKYKYYGDGTVNPALLTIR